MYKALSSNHLPPKKQFRRKNTPGTGHSKGKGLDMRTGLMSLRKKPGKLALEVLISAAFPRPTDALCQ
jgi:hypothetical protein